MPAQVDNRDLQFFVKQCLNDSGFVCRNLLGWNYDEAKDPETGEKIRINEGSGGVRRTGNHAKMVAFVDDEKNKLKLLLAPRGCYKSSLAQGRVVRQILRNPNTRILYGMLSDELVANKAMGIRNCLEKAEVTTLFGNQKGEPWTDTSFTVAGRTQTNLQEPTFSTFSMQHPPTGGHYDLIVLDDLIDDKWCFTSQALEKSKHIFRRLKPLQAEGCTFLVLGTRYHDDDIYNEIEGNKSFSKLIFDSGAVLFKDGGKDSLVIGEHGLQFPHLTMATLKENLEWMGAYMFSCQFNNEVKVGSEQPFLRSYFHPIEWGDDMSGLSCFLLTDTATSQEEEACYSVIAYAGLDAHDNCYLLDLRVGQWRPPQFVDQYFDVLETWQGKVNHCGEVWEDISLVGVFWTTLENDARARKTKLNLIKVARPSSVRKYDRIARLEKPLRDGQFYVCNTHLPRAFTDAQGEKVLWDAEGYKDPRSGLVLPAGELVDEFIRWPRYKKRDIPDAISIIYEYSRQSGKRICRYKPAPPKQKPFSLTENRLHAQSEDELTDWWSQQTKQFYGP